MALLKPRITRQERQTRVSRPVHDDRGALPVAAGQRGSTRFDASDATGYHSSMFGLAQVEFRGSTPTAPVG